METRREQLRRGTTRGSDEEEEVEAHGAIEYSVTLLHMGITGRGPGREELKEGKI